MNTTPLVVVGVGGFGREVLDVLEAVGPADASLELIGVLDDQPSVTNLGRLKARGVRYIGTVGDWLKRESTSAYVIGIGSPAVRQSMARRFDQYEHVPVTLIHPSAQIGSEVRLGQGTIVCAGAVISTNVKLGRHVHLNANSTIGHDSQLDDFVSVNPGAIVSGECAIGEGALIGAGSTILQGRIVGPSSTVGAAACVVRHVQSCKIVKGVPAK